MKSNFEYRKETLEAVIGQPSNVTNSREAAEQLLVALGGTPEPVQTRNVKMRSAMSTSTDSTKIVVPNGLKLGKSTFDVLPDIFDFSQVTDWSYMFSGNAELCRYYGNTMPDIDLTNAANCQAMFSSCTYLGYADRTFLNVSYTTPNCTNFSSMFSYCSAGLKRVFMNDTHNGTNFTGMFNSCSILEYASLSDVSNGKTFDKMFYSCSKLSSINELNTSKGQIFTQMFAYCNNLRTILGLSLSNASDTSYMFDGCTSLTNITLNGGVKMSVNFSSCTSLSYDSIKSILTACSNTNNTNAKTLTLNHTVTDQNGELNTLVTNCNTKGWTITGLTIN